VYLLATGHLVGVLIHASVIVWFVVWPYAEVWSVVKYERSAALVVEAVAGILEAEPGPLASPETASAAESELPLSP
jgi:hypothetical protein